MKPDRLQFFTLLVLLLQVALSQLDEQPLGFYSRLGNALVVACIFALVAHSFRKALKTGVINEGSEFYEARRKDEPAYFRRLLVLIGLVLLLCFGLLIFSVFVVFL